VPDVAGVYVVELAAWAGAGPSDTDVVAVSVLDRPVNSVPVPEAGPDQETTTDSSCYLDAYGNTVCDLCEYTFELDGSDTVDGDLDPLTYSWTVTSGTVTLDDPTLESPTAAVSVVPPALPYTETAEVTLTVTDCLGAVASDSVQLTITCD
jgi:hypothetical protein